MATTYQHPSARTCIDCGATLSPECRGFYCPEHGHEGDGTPLAPVSVVWSSRGRYWAVTVERCPLCDNAITTAAVMVPSPRLATELRTAISTPAVTTWVETAASIAARTLPHGCIGPTVCGRNWSGATFSVLGVCVVTIIATTCRHCGAEFAPEREQQRSPGGLLHW